MLTDFFLSQENQENDRKDSEQDFITELLDPEGIFWEFWILKFRFSSVIHWSYLPDWLPYLDSLHEFECDLNYLSTKNFKNFAVFLIFSLKTIKIPWTNPFEPTSIDKLARADSPNIDFAYKFAAKNSQSPVSVFSGVKHFIFVCWMIIFTNWWETMITYRH